MKDEFLSIAGSNLCLRDIIPKVTELLERMKQQGSKCGTASSSFRKIIHIFKILHQNLTKQIWL